MQKQFFALSKSTKTFSLCQSKATLPIFLGNFQAIKYPILVRCILWLICAIHSAVLLSLSLHAIYAQFENGPTSILISTLMEI